MGDQDLRKEVSSELLLRVNARYYGGIDPSEPEEREVKVQKLYLILAGEGCPGCEVAVEAYQKEIELGNVEVLDLQESELALEIVTKLAIIGLPALVAEDEEGDYLIVDGGVV